MRFVHLRDIWGEVSDLEGNVSAMSSVATAVNTMISDYATAATGIITTNIPVLAAVVGGVILVRFGFSFAKRFGK